MGSAFFSFHEIFKMAYAMRMPEGHNALNAFL